MKEKVLKIKKEPPREKPKPVSEPPQDQESEINRRIIPVALSMIGRSVKLRDVFNLSGVVAADATAVTVTAVGSSGNETDLKSFRFFVDEWHVGMVVRIYAAGVITDDGTRTCTLRIGSGLAPTTEWNSMTSTAATVTNAPWSLTWTGIVNTLGASGTLEAQMQGKINNVNKDDPNTATVALATTTAITIALTADWNGTDAGNSISVRQWIIEILN